MNNPRTIEGRSGGEVTLRLAAAGQVNFSRTFPITGQVFAVKASPVPIRVKLNGVDFGTFLEGDKTRVPEDSIFTEIEISNLSASTVEIVFYAGFADWENQRAATSEPRTAPLPWAGTAIAPSTTQTFAPTLTEGRFRRKALFVTNLDPTARLTIVGAADAPLLAVFPETTIQYPCSEQIGVRNTTGASISCIISELYWII